MNAIEEQMSSFPVSLAGVLLSGVQVGTSTRMVCQFCGHERKNHSRETDLGVTLRDDIALFYCHRCTEVRR
jgi:hypothetical protein